MPSNYTGSASNGFSSTLAMLVDSDTPAAQLWRVPEQGLLDNCVILKARADAADAQPSLRLRTQPITATDTADAMAAVSLADHYGVIAVKTAQTWLLGGDDIANARGVPPSITSLVTRAAVGASSRILIIGTGGNRCAYSDDNGGTWTAGGDIGTTPTALVYDTTHSRFVVKDTSTGTKFSTNGTSWSAGGAISDPAPGDIAVLGNGTLVASCFNAGITFSRSTDGSATWADASGTVANATDGVEAGSIAGNGGTYVYHFARQNNGTTPLFRVSRSSDGNAWTTLADFFPPAGHSNGATYRIMLCQNTGVLVVAYRLTDNNIGRPDFMALRASRDGGVTWTDPLYVFGLTTVTGFALAGGRLLHSNTAVVKASDGLGA